jgi:hypothetical protein
LTCIDCHDRSRHKLDYEALGYNVTKDSSGNLTSATKPGSTLNLATLTEAPPMPQTGDIDGDSEVTTSDAVYLAKHVVELSGYETIFADGNIDGKDDGVTMSDAVYLAKHVVGLSGYGTIY